MKRATLLVLALLAARPAIATETYNVTKLPIVPHPDFGIGPRLNANGQIVAVTEDPNGWVVLWQQGVLESFAPLPGHYGMDITDLSDDGRITGISFGDDPPIGFVYEHGTLTPLPAFGGGAEAAPGGINRSGVVAGYSVVDGLPLATIWDDAIPSALQLPAGFEGSVATCLNDAGVVAGLIFDIDEPVVHLARWTDGTPEDLGTLPGALSLRVMAINESNVIVGSADMDSAVVPVCWVDGVLEALPMPAGCVYGSAWDVNERGQIVGLVEDFATGEKCAVIWEDGVPIDIATLVEPGAIVEITDVTSINDRGQIVGQGWFDGNEHRVFLLTPRVDALAGNVNVQNGPPANVLLVNGSAGDAADRTITLPGDASIAITMDRPPAMPGSAGFALYVFAKAPNASTVTALPFGLGDSAMPMPPSGPGAHPLRIWNNLGKVAVLGSPDFPSSPAPSTVLNRPSGLGKVGTFTFQGIIRDTASPNGVAAITNGIVVQSN